MNEDQTPVEEADDQIIEETEALETAEEKAEEASADQQSKIDRQLDFSDVEEDRECPFDIEKRKRIIEALLFVSDKPIGLSQFVSAFGFDEQENPVVYTREIEEALEEYKLDIEEENRGFRLNSVSGGYQLRSAEDLKPFVQNTIKARTFRLTGPTLEALAIIAYKQPLTKSQVDDVRGVDSSHLIRGLMDKDLLAFAGKSELPGKPMLYKTTTKFLEIFGLRNLNELPSLSEIEALIPEGIGAEEEQEEEQTLSQLTGKLSEEDIDSYSVSEEEHDKIAGELSDISTSTEFFEQEKQRERERKEVEKAEGIREALMVGEEVSNREKKWLERFDEKLKAKEEEANTSETEEASSDQVETLEATEAVEEDVATDEAEADTFEDFGAEEEESFEASESDTDEEFEASEAEDASMEASSLDFEEEQEPEEEEVSLMDDIAESDETDVEPLNDL